MKIIEETYIEDKELGTLLIRVHPRARRMTFRTKRDAIQISVPPGTTLQAVERAIDELRDRLLADKAMEFVYSKAVVTETEPSA